MEMYRKLTQQEEKEFRDWARQNYKPMSPINETWHPVVRDECVQINTEVRVKKVRESANPRAEFFNQLNDILKRK